MRERAAVLDRDLIAALRATVPVPLVLHGASGVSDVELIGAVAAGMTKINISSHLTRAFMRAIRAGLDADPELLDSRDCLGQGRAAVTEEACRLLTLLGCV
jgi:fructose-bisphosphate aldolase class II